MRSSELLQVIIEQGGHDYFALGHGYDEEPEEGTEEFKILEKGKGKANVEELVEMEKDLVLGTANAHIASSLLRSESEDYDFDSDSDEDE